MKMKLSDSNNTSVEIRGFGWVRLMKHSLVTDSGCSWFVSVDSRYDKYFIFKLVGGINKGHPDEQDLKNAQKFILDIMKKYEEEK